MKKLAIVAALAVGSLAFAQQYGIKGGMNVSSTSKDPNINDSRSKIGFNVGVFVNAPLGSQFSIQPELLYTQYGNKNTSSSTTIIGGSTITTENTGSLNLDYIALPVMFHYNAIPQFYFEAGPEFGLLISAKAKGDFKVTNTSPNNGLVTTSSNAGSVDVKDNYNTFNLGIGAGAGYYFTPTIGITARYVAGITKINKYHIANSSDNVINSVFQLGLTYKFSK